MIFFFHLLEKMKKFLFFNPIGKIIEIEISSQTILRNHRIEIFTDGIHGKKYRYIGHFVIEGKTILPDGRGKLFVKNGSYDELIYEGNWLKGKYHGPGKSFFNNGKIDYDGIWKHHLQHDKKGTFYHKSNQKKYYYGQVIDGKITGKGTYYDNNGKRIYLGEVKDNERSGIGSEYNMLGKVIYSGHWKKNQRDGLGVSFYSHSGIVRYYGHWKGGKKDGKGMLYLPTGTLQYIGFWKNDSRNGFGTEFHNDLRPQYTGNWKDNIYNGNGTLYDNDGQILYTGNFLKGNTEHSVRKESQIQKFKITRFLNTNEDKYIKDLTVNDLKKYLKEHYHENSKASNLNDMKRILRERYRMSKENTSKEDAIDRITYEKITDPVIANDEFIYNKSTIENVWKSAPSTYDDDFKVVKIFPKLLGGVPVHSYYTMNDLNSSKAIPKKDKLKKKLGNFFTKNFSEV